MLDRDVLLNRFVRYAEFGTGSKENCNDIPTTKNQSIFLDRLYREISSIVEDSGSVQKGKTGYVYAKLDATEGQKKIGFVTHVDTYPELSANRVGVRVHKNYQGGDISLSEGVVIGEEELRPYLNQTIITSDGKSLLGGDDKAGVAAVVSALEDILKNNITHPEIHAVFTHDEEVFKGTSHLEIEKFPVDFAYTVDGGILGEFEYESFNAAKATVTVRGREHHPGYGKGIRKNAMYVGSKIIANIPKEILAENTEKREPYLEPDRSIVFSTDKFEHEFLLRAFEQNEIKYLELKIKEIVSSVQKQHPDYQIDLSVESQYFNMKNEIEKRPEVLEIARKAFEMSGVPMKQKPIRGGTDGVMITLNYNIPTPNIFTGTHNLHSKEEFVPLESMEKASEILINIAKLSAQV